MSPHIYYAIDYVPTPRVNGYINRIECQGREEQLQDCVIESVSNGQPTCTMIGTIEACYDYCKYTTKLKLWLLWPLLVVSISSTACHGEKITTQGLK